MTKRVNTHAGLMLEMHYFPWKNDRFGHSPFVAAQPGSDEIITAIGMGWMFGWKVSAAGNKGFALGFGYSAQPTAKVLGDEFVENQPAPKGPDDKPLAVRLQTRDKGAVLFISSFVF